MLTPVSRPIVALSMERIANDVLSLGKIQLATLEVFAVAVDLPTEVRKLLSLFEVETRTKGQAFRALFGLSLMAHSLADAGIRVALELGEELRHASGQHHKFMTDPVRLGQVIINL